MKAIIIDDEISARELLLELLKRHCPTIQVMDACEDLTTGVAAIKKHNAELVFLDVKMPMYNGYEIVDFFEQIDFNIIFITAYDQYALKAFEISATDYLLKPIEIARLKTAVAKATEQHAAKQSMDQLHKLSQNLKKSNQKYKYSDRGLTNYIMVADIICVEAQRAYSTFSLVNGKQITVSKNVKTISEELEEFSQLLRTHRSWIVNLDHVINYSKTNLTISMANNIEAKISRPNKTEFINAFNNYFATYN